jgi:hypothetical protein
MFYGLLRYLVHGFAGFSGTHQTDAGRVHPEISSGSFILETDQILHESGKRLGKSEIIVTLSSDLIFKIGNSIC